MEWKEVRLESILALPSRNGLTKPSKIRGKGVKMIGMGELFANPIIYDIPMDRVPVTDKELSNSRIMPGDLLFARQSLTLEGAGKCCYVKEVKEETVFESHLIRIRIDKTKADAEFIYYFFNSFIGKCLIQNLVTQVAAAGIRGSELVKLDITIPKEVEDQRRIASILSSLDRKIELNNKINTDLEEMAQAIFKNWFVDFEPFKDGKFVDSELGMIPEGWKVGTLEDIAEITMGQSPAGNSLNENREGMIFYQGSSDFGFRFPSIRVFTTEPKRLAVANSVLFSVRAPVGDINVAKEECCIGRGVASIKSKYGHDSYLFYTMKSLHKLFDSFDGEGTVFGSINKKTLSAIQILLPSDGIVEQFNNIASSFDDRIRSLSDENSRLSSLRDTLLPRLMSGELEVPE